MTLLVSWCGVDSRGPTSLYIAADSRITWKYQGQIEATFDYGRKVFTSKRYPDVVGYCGDVLFPVMTIPQILELADCGLLFTEMMSCDDRFNAFKSKLLEHFQCYPQSVMNESFQIIYASRDLSNPRSFYCYLIEWNQGGNFTSTALMLPTSSSVLVSLGSGGSYFRKNQNLYCLNSNESTSRYVFHCFCETLFSNADEHCGGVPQLVGLYSKPNSQGQQFGIVRCDKRYLYGAEVNKLSSYNSIEWRNDLFERVDGQTMQIMNGAQRQPDPLRTS